MLSTKNLVNDYKEVPVSWIFEYYGKLNQQLSGQDIKIRSLFSSKDRTPSMCIYMDKSKNQYKFKDFSTGIGGSAIDLVKELKHIDFRSASRLIVEDYNEFILHNNGGYDVAEFKEHAKYQVVDHLKRPWNTRDQYFWTQFNIGSRLLESHNVYPLENYCMCKVDEEGNTKELSITGSYIYGYFTNNGELYKIYQPKVRNKKFIKVQTHLQGLEQLQNHPVLIITSSLKDMMALKSLKLSVDTVAPDSENTMIRKEIIDDFKKRYKKVLVMFDNDDAGIKAMAKYRDNYATSPVLLTTAKDVADAIKIAGPGYIKEKLVPLIDHAVCL